MSTHESDANQPETAMDDSTENQNQLTRRCFLALRRLLEYTFVIGLMLLLLSMLSPSINHGPPGPRAVSLNNLKCIGLSVHNYATEHDGSLPPHAILSLEGSPNFGWATSLLPFLEQTNLYEHLELEKPWDDSANQELASRRLEIFLNPRVDGPTEEHGYALLHYAVNSQLVRPDKSWSLDEISDKDGLGNTILCGEISNHFRPWAAPGSLRDPVQGIGDSPDQFGMEVEDGLVIFAFADGSSKPVSRDIDPKILKAWATPDGGEIIPEQ
jgi:hypothetical protein